MTLNLGKRGKILMGTIEPNRSADIACCVLEPSTKSEGIRVQVKGSKCPCWIIGSIVDSRCRTRAGSITTILSNSNVGRAATRNQKNQKKEKRKQGNQSVRIQEQNRIEQSMDLEPMAGAEEQGTSQTANKLQQHNTTQYNVLVEKVPIVVQKCGRVIDCA